VSTVTYDDLAARWAPTLGWANIGRVIRDEMAQPPREEARDKWPAVQESRAFVTDHAGKTLITAPASALAAMGEAAGVREPTVEDITSEPMLWMSGKFVGAEVPNRNGALWTSGDLEMSASTVVNGPLNWLHEGRHIIGAIGSAEYVSGKPGTLSGGEAAAAVQPHIAAKAGIWRWLYPDEAYVVQQASDAKSLWYSMECISSEVACAGPNGCGNSTSYAQYMAGAACEHVKERASVRHFKNPVFLGGAVIVPPTRPGWAEAEASVLAKQTVGKLAEAAFEQAGEPDITASCWEQMMAQIVQYAEGD
jgi:hypothetical protein